MKIVLSGREIGQAIVDYVEKNYGLHAIMDVNLMCNPNKTGEERFSCEVTESEKPIRRNN